MVLLVPNKIATRTIGNHQSTRQTIKTRSARATEGRACSGAASRSSSTELSFPTFDDSTSNFALHNLPPIKPMTAAAKMIIGNGTLKKKIEINAAVAIAHITSFFNARLPMRMTAASILS